MILMAHDPTIVAKNNKNQINILHLILILLRFHSICIGWADFFFKDNDTQQKAFNQCLLTHSAQWCNTTEQPLDGACHITVNPMTLPDYSVDLPWVSGAPAINLSAERCTRLSGRAFSSQWACGATCRSPARTHNSAGFIRLIWERTAGSLRSVRQWLRQGGLQELCHRKLGQPFGTTIVFRHK